MKEILLSRGKVALVDDSDYGELSRYKWCAWTPNKGETFYAMRSIWGRNGDKKKCVYMHRQVMGVTDRNIKVDHRDHNGLNNQRANLRQATQSQNMANIVNRSKGSSKYIGVYFSTKSKKWVAQITKNYKNKRIGTFESENEAAMAYNKTALQVHGEFANINSIK